LTLTLSNFASMKPSVRGPDWQLAICVRPAVVDLVTLIALQAAKRAGRHGLQHVARPGALQQGGQDRCEQRAGPMTTPAPRRASPSG
jgi:hypothetical protein